LVNWLNKVIGKKNSVVELLFLPFLIVSIFPFGSLLSSHRFLILTIGVFVCTLFQTVIYNVKYKVKFVDFFFLFFIVYNLVVGFFSTNVSLLFYPLSISVLCFACYLFISNILNPSLIVKAFQAIFFLRILLFFSSFIFLHLFNSSVIVCDLNKNADAVFLLCLWPFTWNMLNFKFNIQLNVIVGIILFAVLFCLKSKIAIVSFFLFCLFSLYRYFNKYLIIILLLLSTLCVYYFISKFHDTLYSEVIARLMMSLYSLKVFVTTKFIGSGLGNLFIESYYDNAINSKYFISPSYFDSLIRQRDHNLLTSCIGNSGLFGFLSISIFVLYKFYSPGVKGCNNNVIFKSSIVIYFLTSLFYLSNQSYQYHFSHSQFIAIVSIGFIMDSPKYLIESKIINSLLLIVLSNVVLFFCLFSLRPQSQNRLLFYLPKELKINHLLQNSYILNINDPYLLDLNKSLIVSKKDSFLIDNNFNKLIKLYPNDANVRMSYGEWLETGNNNSKAIEQYESVYNLQSNYFPNCTHLLEFYLDGDYCDNIQDLLNNINISWHNHFNFVSSIELYVLLNNCIADDDRYKSISDDIEEKWSEIKYRQFSKKNFNKKEVRDYIKQLEQDLYSKLDSHERLTYLSFKSKYRIEHAFNGLDFNPKIEDQIIINGLIIEYYQIQFNIDYSKTNFKELQSNFTIEMEAKLKNEIEYILGRELQNIEFIKFLNSLML